MSNDYCGTMPPKPPEGAKRTSDSYTEQIQLLNQSGINGYGRLFGGQLTQWIDVVAAVVARRHSGCNVTTAAIDNLQFLAPAYPNDSIFVGGKADACRKNLYGSMCQNIC